MRRLPKHPVVEKAYGRCSGSLSEEACGRAHRNNASSAVRRILGKVTVFLNRNTVARVKRAIKSATA